MEEQAIVGERDNGLPGCQGQCKGGSLPKRTPLGIRTRFYRAMLQREIVEFNAGQNLW